MNREIPNNFKSRPLAGETVLRQCQLVQLRLLDVLDEICRTNDLKYMLAFGSLLGAMRHGGFIPWDDDLDVYMPEKDYRKFIKIARNYLPSDVSLQTPHDTPWQAIPFVKLRDNNSFYFEVRGDSMTKDPSGIYIDVFCLSQRPKAPLFAYWPIYCASSSFWCRSKFFLSKANKSPVHAVVCGVMSGACLIMHLASKLIYDLLCKLMPGGEWGIPPLRGYRGAYSSQMIFPLTVHEFEDGMYPIPADADAVLKVDYGDWHKIPPPEKRPRHAKIISPVCSEQ